MLGGSGTKKLNSRTMSDGIGLEKVSSTQYLRQGWHEKAIFTENAWQDCYETSIKKLL